MGRHKATKIKQFSCIFILCFFSFLLGTWIHSYMVTTKYNLSNFLQPTRYQWTHKHKTGEIKLFEKNQERTYNTTCVRRIVSLSKTELPLTGLVSFPGSGNTWARHLLQQMTGSWTDTSKYNLSNFLQPVLYHWTYKNQTRQINFFKNNRMKLHNTSCVKRNVSLSKNPLPLTGLVSFPGSGNTWTRHLIQQMTGLGTSSVYCDKGLEKGGFPFECQKQRNKTIVIKTHAPKDVSLFKKIIFLIRNPYDAFLSFTNFQRGGHTGRPSEAKMIESLTRTFNKSLEWYVNLTRKITMKFKGPIHVLQYEKLKTDMATELGKLAEFLGVIATQRDIYCTIKQQEGNFHRNTTDENNIKLFQRIFKKEKLLRIQKTARYTEKLLKDAYDMDIDLKGPEDQLFLKEV